MKSYGATHDEDGIPIGRVTNSATYNRQLLLWRRRIGNGTLTCEQLLPDRAARRLVRLTANYTDAGDEVCAVAIIEDEDDERLTASRFEQRMLMAQVRSATQPSDVVEPPEISAR